MPPRFKLTPPEPSEDEIHEACASALDALLLEPAQWACYPAGHIQLSGAQADKLRRHGLKPNWPDLFIVFNALTFGFEVKTRAGKLSKTRFIVNKRGKRRLVEGQEDVFPRLRKAGMSITVVHSVDELLAACRYIGIPIRATVTQPQLKLVAASSVAA
jgi:hypothetical protein